MFDKFFQNSEKFVEREQYLFSITDKYSGETFFVPAKNRKESGDLLLLLGTTACQARYMLLNIAILPIVIDYSDFCQTLKDMGKPEGMEFGEKKEDKE